MRTLLLADDNVTVQRVIALTFAREPVRVVTVSDGNQAMDRVLMDRPDIVLAGTTLPQVNGYELARFVRSKAESKDVPVLLLSGAFETVDEAELESSGANGIIEKPVEPTNVISRVKELLGIASDERAAAAGRLVTPASPMPHRPPTTPRMVTSSRPMPERPRKPEAPDSQEQTAGDDDYLDSLTSAFDSLDQQLAGKVAATPQRHQSQPAGNPVYEVDDNWFGDGSPREQDATATPPQPESQPVYEVDSEWFAEGDKANAARAVEQRELAAEMGIHEVIEVAGAPGGLGMPEVPEVPGVPGVPEVLRGGDGSEEPEYEPVARSLPIDWFAIGSSRHPQPIAPSAEVERAATAIRESEPMEVPRVAPIPHEAFGSPGAQGRVADDFAALLAYEQGEKKSPPMIEPVIHTVTPEITSDMLDQIASTVADRLSGSIRVEPQAPVIDEEMLKAVAALVSDRLKDSIRVEPAIPEISSEMISTIASLVSSQLKDQVRVEPAAPVITDAIVEQVSAQVAGRLKDSIRVETVAPELTGAMLDRVATQVSERMQAMFSVDSMRESIAASIRETVREVVLETSERLVREEIDRIKSKNL